MCCRGLHDALIEHILKFQVVICRKWMRGITQVSLDVRRSVEG